MKYYFSEEEKNQLKDEWDIVDVCEQVGITLQTKGSYIYALCPNSSHDDHRFGSCRINKNKQICTCFACQKSWDVYGIIEETQGLSFIDAVLYLAQLSGRLEDFEVEEDKPKKLFLSKKELELLGIPFLNHPIKYNQIVSLSESKLKQKHIIYKYFYYTKEDMITIILDQYKKIVPNKEQDYRILSCIYHKAVEAKKGANLCFTEKELSWLGVHFLEEGYYIGEKRVYVEKRSILSENMEMELILNKCEEKAREYGEMAVYSDRLEEIEYARECCLNLQKIKEKVLEFRNSHDAHFTYLLASSF